MKYESKFTNFQTDMEVLTNTMYYKDINKTICIIHVNDDWSMNGKVLDPFDLPISPIKPIFTDLDQEMCEKIIMRTMPPPYRQDILKKYNFKVMDYGLMLYKTRLINLLDTYWMAWSEDDKVEDYHPRFNEYIDKERSKNRLQFDHDSDYVEQELLKDSPYLFQTELTDEIIELRKCVFE